MANTHCCILCGISVVGTDTSPSQIWLRQFRAVYRKGTDFNITGVGWFDSGALFHMAPRDPLLRWDVVEQADLMYVPVMRDSGIRGVHGFILHDACWNILQKASEPRGLTTERLVRVFESIPCPFGFPGVCWGHDYGGLLTLDVDNAYPWNERFETAEDLGAVSDSFQTAEDLGAMSDPFYTPSIQIMASKQLDHFPVESTRLHKSADQFSRLSWELLEMIAIHLPTKDALNLRLASWSFQPLFSNFGFWLSRFQPGRERDFLFDVVEAKPVKHVGELLHIHRQSKRSIATPELKNRERVWKLARKLVPILQSPLTCGVTSQDTTLDSSEELTRLAAMEHPPVSGEEWERFDSGCRPTSIIQIDVPSGPVDVGITTVNFGAWDYVTGIRLRDKAGNEEFAGYDFGQDEVVCSLKALHGFRVAMGQGGVRALQVVGPGQHTSRWAGRFEGMPQSDRLVMKGPAARLSMSVDGYKVTALALSMSQPGHGQDTVSRTTAGGLRQVALWYPEIPPTDLFLNDDSFCGRDPLSTGYQPLSWIHFGGLAGESLAHIRGIQAQHMEALQGIQVMYDKIHKNGCSDKLGRCIEEALPSGPLFPIDGAGGERIEQISAGSRCYPNDNTFPFLRHGVVKCIEITTNRGRTMRIGKAADDLEIRPLSIAPGTTITGLYGHSDVMYGLISLGVISEVIESPFP